MDDNIPCIQKVQAETIKELQDQVNQLREDAVMPSACGHMRNFSYGDEHGNERCCMCDNTILTLEKRSCDADKSRLMTVFSLTLLIISAVSVYYLCGYYSQNRGGEWVPVQGNPDSAQFYMKQNTVCGMVDKLNTDKLYYYGEDLKGQIGPYITIEEAKKAVEDDVNGY